MINYFTIKSVILLISVFLLSFFYQYTKGLFLKSIRLDPNISTSLNLYSFYLGYTNYNLIKFSISLIGYLLYNMLNIENII